MILTIYLNKFKHIVLGEKLILIFLVIGFIYRFYFASISETKVIYDVASYTRMAHEILSGQWTIDCCDQNVGYGMFLAIVYKIFGMDNLHAVQLIQIVMDLGTAGLIYLTVKSISWFHAGPAARLSQDSLQVHREMNSSYKSSYSRSDGGARLRKPSLASPAMISFILYILNPFTASYVGLRMPETVTIFVTVLIAYIITRETFRKKEYWWFLLGLSLGIFLFLRMAMSLAVYSFILLSAWLFFKKLFKVYFLAIVLSGFIIGSSYSLISNYYNFHKFSLTPLYSLGKSQLYYNFFRDRYPELFVDFDKVNPTLWDLQLETHRTYYTDMTALKKKYDKLFVEKMQKDWPLFIRNTVKNIFWLWDKDHLAYYSDPYYPADVWTLRIINIISLGLFGVGFGGYWKKMGRDVYHNPLFLFTLLQIVNITFLFSLVSNETRHSIYFYGLVYLWAGYGVGIML